MVPPQVAEVSPAAARAAVAIAAGLFGLLVGSFLNVVVYRVPRGLSVVRPGSFCPTCGTPVQSYDNVPVVSWIVLGGRCRSCRSPISARYPLVEGLTGALFALVAALVGPHLAVPAMCALTATFLATVVIDLDRQAAPTAVSLIGGGIALGLFVLPAAAPGHWGSFTAAAITGAAVLAVALALGWRAPAQSPRSSPAVRGALCTAFPLGVLLGWLGVGCPGAAVTGAATAVVGAVAVGLARPPDGSGRWRPVLGLPIASALGAAVAFGVAAGLGWLNGA